MSDTDKASKTEDPTSKKLSEAWAEGNFAKASEIPAVFTLIAAFIVLAFFGPERASVLGHFGREIFIRLNDIHLNVETSQYYIQLLITSGGAFMMPLLGAVFLAAIISNGLQTGFRLSPKALEPKLSKLDPIKGMQKLFSAQKIVQFLVDLFKFAVVAAILYFIIRKISKDPIFFDLVAPDHVLSFMYETFMLMFINLILAIGVIAAIHYIYQKKKTWDDLKMTQQEVRDEMKNQEGNPHVKRARREMAMRMSQNQMLEGVPTADVVVTNPTHFAIALKYERGKDKAPMILAKGEQRFARRIKEIARKNGVPMVENKPVARMLFRFGKVGEPVPSQLYQVIAEILSHVYRTNRYYFYQLQQRRLNKSLNG